MGLPRIAVLRTGGTIESVGKDRLDLAWYPDNDERLEDGELIRRVPELTRIAEIVEIPSRSLDPDMLDWLRWLGLIQRAAADGAAGVVVTHGTNPLDELAYFLHLTIKTTVPVVVTGAMRPSSGLGADGYLNLVNAVRVAVHPAAAGLGVLVVMNDAILSARDVVKASTHRIEAFRAPDLGPLGYADADGAVVIAHRPARPHTIATVFDVARLTELPRVDIVMGYVGSDGALIDAAVAAGARGIVSAASGAGRPNKRENEALDRAASAGVVVVQASRTGSGRTTPSPWLRRRGLIAAGDLQPWKARVLLVLGLTVTHDVCEMQRVFDTY
jgi:L-asparaginase